MTLRMQHYRPLLLIIVVRLNKNSPVERFIKALMYANHPYQVFCNEGNSELIKEQNVEIFEQKPLLSNRLAKLGLVLTRYDWLNYSFERKAVESITGYIKSKRNSKLVFMPFVHMGDFSPLQIAHKLKKKFGYPFWIHTVDPLPSVPGWGEKPIFRKSVVKALKPIFKNVDLFSANNHEMTAYQAHLMEYQGSFFTHFTVSNSMQKSDKIAYKNNPEEIVFVYAGSFYGRRQPDMLLRAFAEYVQQLEQPRVSLHIYGKNNINLESYGFSKKALKQIKIKGYTDKIKDVLNEADVLIDIDANIPNDVFMSGKIVEYLGFHKPILVISPLNSPVRQVFEGDNRDSGLFFSTYDLNILIDKINSGANFNCSDEVISRSRRSLIVQFEAKEVVAKMEEELNKLAYA